MYSIMNGVPSSSCASIWFESDDTGPLAIKLVEMGSVVHSCSCDALVVGTGSLACSDLCFFLAEAAG